MTSNAFKCDVDLLTSNDDGKATSPRRLLCVHTFEGRDLSAEAMARYQLSPAAGGSYHLVIDRDGNTARENDDDYVPWAAMYTGNRIAFHFSLAGRAAMTRDEWLARPKQLEKLAQILAAYSARYVIPLLERAAIDVKAGNMGVCGHAEISAAFRESDHTDPGPNFPYDVVLDRARELRVNGNIGTSQKKDTIMPDQKYPSFVDGRELRFSEFIRFIDEKTTRLYDAAFPDGGTPPAINVNDGKTGNTYPSYVDKTANLTLDQFVRFIDWKITQLCDKETQK